MDCYKKKGVHETICVFDKNWSIYSKKTFYIKPYQHWFKIFLSLWKKMQVQTFDEKLIWTLKEQYGSNHNVFDTVFLRTF